MKVDEYLAHFIDMNEDELVATQYISYKEKVKICEEVFRSAMFDERGKYKANTPKLNLLYQMRLIKEYTILEIEDDEKDFDKLEVLGLVELLQSFIDPHELERFDEILSWVMEDYRGGKA